MKTKITLIAGALIATASLGLAGPASADASIKGLAKADCRQELREEPREFEVRYGGTDAVAIKRCARQTKREAVRDCKQERRFESGEFAAEYGGTDKKALKRCIKDELL